MWEDPRRIKRNYLINVKLGFLDLGIFLRFCYEVKDLFFFCFSGFEESVTKEVFFDLGLLNLSKRLGLVTGFVTLFSLKWVRRLPIQ